MIKKNHKISVHSSINFFIYCFASKRFRGSLRSFLAPIILLGGRILPLKRSLESTSTSNLPMSEISPLNQNQWMSIFTFGFAHLAKKISRDQRINWNGWFVRQLCSSFIFPLTLTCFRRIINFYQSTSVRLYVCAMNQWVDWTLIRKIEPDN